MFQRYSKCFNNEICDSTCINGEKQPTDTFEDSEHMFCISWIAQVGLSSVLLKQEEGLSSMNSNIVEDTTVWTQMLHQLISPLLSNKLKLDNHLTDTLIPFAALFLQDVQHNAWLSYRVELS